MNNNKCVFIGYNNYLKKAKTKYISIEEAQKIPLEQIDKMNIKKFKIIFKSIFSQPIIIKDNSITNIDFDYILLDFFKQYLNQLIFSFKNEKYDPDINIFTIQDLKQLVYLFNHSYLETEDFKIFIHELIEDLNIDLNLKLTVVNLFNQKISVNNYQTAALIEENKKDYILFDNFLSFIFKNINQIKYIHVLINKKIKYFNIKNNQFENIIFLNHFYDLLKNNSNSQIIVESDSTFLNDKDEKYALLFFFKKNFNKIENINKDLINKNLDINLFYENDNSKKNREYINSNIYYIQTNLS